VEGERSRLMPLLPSIVGKQRAREGNLKQERDEEKECGMVLSGKRMRYLYLGERHAATVMGAISFPVLAINSDASRIMHRASVIQTVKQIVQLPRESTQRRDSRANFDTYCGLIKVCRTYHQPTTASGKACQNSLD
jgi:hypothetical protein